MKVRYMQSAMPFAYGQRVMRSAVEEIVDVLPDSPMEFETLDQANEYAKAVYGNSAFCVEIDPPPATKVPLKKDWYEAKIESEKGMEIGAGTLKPQDDLADRLGQIIFRIETNFYGFSASNPKSQEERNLAILADIEKLKGLKKELET